MTDGGYVIIDFTTTALSDGRVHIVEVAVVHTDPTGAVTGLWETLVDPGQRVVDGELDGIDASDLEAAPTFEQVAPDLTGLLSGRVIVAHHARYETGRLLSELSEVADRLRLPPLGVLQIAAETMSGRNDRAADRCGEVAVGVAGSRRALVHAIAAARLLAILLRTTDDLAYWSGLVDHSAKLVWPPLSVVDVEWMAREIGPDDPRGFLERIPRHEVDRSTRGAHVEYFTALDTSLTTPPLSAADADRLVMLAARRRIGREMCAQLHLAYFEDLARIAWGRGMTATDLADLVTVGRDLSIPLYLVRAAVAAKRQPDGVDSEEWTGNGRDSDRRQEPGVDSAA